jgi:hypothetical protein
MRPRPAAARHRTRMRLQTTRHLAMTPPKPSVTSTQYCCYKLQSKSPLKYIDRHHAKSALSSAVLGNHKYTRFTFGYLAFCAPGCCDNTHCNQHAYWNSFQRGPLDARPCATKIPTDLGPGTQHACIEAKNQTSETVDNDCSKTRQKRFKIKRRIRLRAIKCK